MEKKTKVVEIQPSRRRKRSESVDPAAWSAGCVEDWVALLFVGCRSRVCYRLGLVCEVGRRSASLTTAGKGENWARPKQKRGPSFNLAENLYWRPEESPFDPSNFVIVRFSTLLFTNLDF